MAKKTARRRSFKLKLRYLRDFQRRRVVRQTIARLSGLFLAASRRPQTTMSEYGWTFSLRRLQVIHAVTLTE